MAAAIEQYHHAISMAYGSMANSNKHQRQAGWRKAAMACWRRQRASAGRSGVAYHGVAHSGISSAARGISVSGHQRGISGGKIANTIGGAKSAGGDA